jgi:putative ABC transport system permease protein
MGSQSEVGMRDTHGVGWIADFRLDLVYALRQLRLNPGFAGATILTLALGIGAATTVFSIGRAVDRPFFPFEAPERLVYVRQHPRSCLECDRMAAGNYVTIRDESRTIKSISIASGWPFIHRGVDRSELLPGFRVSSEFFQTLGIGPLLGRTLTAPDSESSRNHVVVLSEDTWRSRFASDSNVLGQPMVLDGDAYTIVGVVASAGAYPYGAAMWTPLSVDAQRMADRSSMDYIAVARLRDGIAFQAARAELSLLGNRMAAEHSESMKGQTFSVVSLKEWHNRGIGDEAVIFLSAVGFVLLIACVNLAGLFLARLIGRRRELAVRSALGASPTRVAGQLILETVLLSIIGGALGAAVSGVALRLVRNAVSASMIARRPEIAHIAPDGAALVTALSMGLLTGLVIGVWPAVRFARPDIVGELMDAPRGATASRGGASFRQGAAVAQMGFAIMLLSAATLLVRSARATYAVRPGFEAEHVLALRYHDAINSPRRFGDPERRDRLVLALEALPGVRRAAAALDLPYDDEYYSNRVLVVRNGPRRSDSVTVPLQAVTAGYFDVLGIPIIGGRGFNDDDRSGTLPVTIINQVLANRLFPDESPVGEALTIDRSQWIVIGVSGNVSYGSVRNPVAPEVFRVMRQRPGGVTTGIEVRAQGDPAPLAASVRRVVREFDADVAITRMQPLAARQSDALAPIRLSVGMMTFFAVAATLISAIGLYGVVSYGAAQRTREFGVRLALGATQESLLRLVLRQGVRLAAAGAVLGGLGALAATRLMRSLLFHVSPSDPTTYVLVTLGIGMVALAASYLPARRASRVDPVQALRHD